ncbi:unnamed protein product, partial [marine sediment metagenome]
GYCIYFDDEHSFCCSIHFQPGAVNGTDVHVVSGSDTNYGTGTNFQYKGGTLIALVNWNNSCVYVPVGATIDYVEMEVEVEAYTVAITVIHPMNNTWDESTVTGNNCGTGGFCLGSYDSDWDILVSDDVTGTGNKTIRINETWYQEECEKPANERYGLAIFGAAGGDSTALVSSDIARPRSHPKLLVNYTVEVDSTPPVISEINFTSFNVPYGDNETPYEGEEDSTPSTKHITDENAWCQLNGTDCSGGQGGTVHTCTLASPLPFNVYTLLNLSCNDSLSNMNYTMLNVSWRDTTFPSLTLNKP